MNEDVGTLWRDTLGADAFATLDPRATCKLDSGERGGRAVQPNATLAPVGPSATMAPIVTNATLAPVPLPESIGEVAVEAAYRIGAELGQGGMAVVHRAHQSRLRRDVALKIAHDTARLAARKRFVAEAQVTGALDHPNIVPVHDLVETPDGRLALAMKLVEGEPWARALQKGTRTLAEHVGILVDVCNAVAFAHRRGFAHADLKPENVMLGEFGEVAVMDWGCAVAIGPVAPGEAPITQRPEDIKRPFGTPAYMAPELALGQGPRIGARTDVYLLGAILFHVLTGRPPHLRETLTETLAAAVLTDAPVLPDTAPAPLAAICRRAMAPAPDDRYPAVLELRDALVHWLETRKSQQLSDEADVTLRACAERAAGPADATAAASAARMALYIDLEQALSGFQQARKLWPDNVAAAVGEEAARKLLVETALRHGDLGLAEAHASRVPEDRGRAELVARVDRARAAAEQEARTGRTLRMALFAAVAAVFAAVSIGLVEVVAARNEARAAAQLAEARLAEIQQLSDVQLLDQQEALARTLWPALPDKVPALTQWLGDARALVARRDGHARKLAQLQAVEAPDVATLWERDTLAHLVAGLEHLEATVIPEVEHRLQFARTIEQRSLGDHKVAWDVAIGQIAADPRYHGLVLAPQLGLVPLGADPVSGLQEFAHLATGEAPARADDGRIVPFDGMGVVLVLLPGGTFTMGAAPGPSPGPNVDPMAKPSEGPPHPVALGPFFFGKYEFTQDQWLRFTGTNPSAYAPGRDIGGHVVTELHPVEQVGLGEAIDVLSRLALTLPTEAQWEYAARAGTTTPFWTGLDLSSLQGAANIADRWGKTHGGPESWMYEESLDDGWLSHAPIGTFRASPFGIHDTAGNVWEWCRDRTGPYTAPTRDGDGAREAPDTAPGLFRGGGFRANRAHARSADRYPLPSSDYKGFDIGFRAARAITP